MQAKPAARETVAGAVASFLKAKPLEPEPEAEDEPGAPQARPAAPPGVVELPPIEDAGGDDEGVIYAPLPDRPEPPGPAADSPGAGPANLGGFAATIHAERQRERDARKAQERAKERSG
jgi:hypothetical protein